VSPQSPSLDCVLSQWNPFHTFIHYPQYSDWLWTGRLGFDSWQGLGIFLFNTMSRLALGPTQPPIQWVPGAFSRWIKWLGGGGWSWPLTSCPGQESMELYLHSPITPSWRGAYLKHRDNFTFYTLYFSKIHFNIVSQLMPRSYKWFISSIGQDLAFIFSEPYNCHLNRSTAFVMLSKLVYCYARDILFCANLTEMCWWVSLEFGWGVKVIPTHPG
jgi:hypothetical protein